MRNKPCVQRAKLWFQDHAMTVGFLLLFLYVTVVLALGFAATQNQQDTINENQDAFNAAAIEARNANCQQFERDHLEDIQALERAYESLPKTLAFFNRLTPSDLQPLLRSLALSDLRRLEMEANTDRAPQYCDENGFGLPEPDPKVPERPEALNGLDPEG